MNNKILVMLVILVMGSGALCFAFGMFVLHSACAFGFDCDTNNSYVGVIMLVWAGVAVLFVMPRLVDIETSTIQHNLS